MSLSTPGRTLTSTTEHERPPGELRGLLASCQELASRHRSRLHQYRDSDGYVIEEKYPERDDARITTAIEASDHLDTVVQRLADLAGPPAPRAFTLRPAGSERHDGQAPASFVVNAVNLDDAARVLATLPGVLDYYQADAASSEHSADIVYVPEQSHPGLPDPAGTSTYGRSRVLRRLPQRPACPAPGPGRRPIPTSEPAPLNRCSQGLR
ncbi:hypothetical protein [Streptomyces poonensis]|uniref:Uncharacterized protein n=1 Tax=Streptomyces poonensis TaxID=68255 RepID=A0A918QB58_9ACTN|nr:hypothetical protein [Streptomyces poonensis]GGZ40563.1 hypothetical protein GCM10010365_71650 [Streptomyces poonensis]GLJ93042.1 hypothetical protein GCM10017589_56540 [Streptomyces poonensis]